MLVHVAHNALYIRVAVDRVTIDWLGGSASLSRVGGRLLWPIPEFLTASDDREKRGRVVRRRNVGFLFKIIAL